MREKSANKDLVIRKKKIRYAGRRKRCTTLAVFNIPRHIIKNLTEQGGTIDRQTAFYNKLLSKEIWKE